MAGPTGNQPSRAASQQRLDVLGKLNELNLLGQIVSESRTLVSEKARELDVLDNAEPEFARSSAQATSLAILTLSIIPVAYLTDILLFGQLGEFVAIKLLGSATIFKLMGRLVTPAIIVALEMGLGARIHSALHSPVTEPVEGWQKVLWVGLGISMAIVMPLAAYATFTELGSTATTWAPLSLLIILAIVAHVPIIFGGTRALAAKSLLVFRSRRRALTTLLARAETKRAAATEQMRSVFPRYLHQLEQHNSVYGSPITFGPFDSETWRILQELFPADPIEGDLRSQALWFRGIYSSSPASTTPPVDKGQ